MRARNVSRACASDRRITKRHPRLFVRSAGRAGHANRGGNCGDSHKSCRVISGDDGREVRLWGGYAGLHWPCKCVATRFGDIRIKIASLNGTVTSYAPEYEDCRRIAAEHRVPLKMVMQEAVQAYLRHLPEK